jgi:tetratricopeptide (TPR) repeat protein
LVQKIEELRSAGKLREAVPIAEQVLKYCEKNYGPEHAETADALNDLAFLYSSMNDQAKALPLYQRALKIREKALGPDHPYTAISLNNLAEAYRESSDFAKAEPLYKRAIKIWENKLGSKHPNTLSGMSNLALLYQAENREGGTIICAVLKVREKRSPDNPQVADSLSNLGTLYH